MAFDVDIDVTTYLIANVTEKALVRGVSIFEGPEQPVRAGIVDAKAVFVLPFGGPPPETFKSSTTSVYSPDVQIITRGDKTSYRDTKNLSNEIRDLMQSDGAPNIAGYIDVQLVDAEPIYMGQDDKGHPRFALNVKMTKED